MDVAGRKLLRFRFLKLLYEQTGGDTTEYVSDKETVSSLTGEGYARDEIEKAIKFLEAEHLIHYSTGRKVRFEHGGVKEIEDALEKPNQDTPHFPSNIIVIGTMHSGSIQQGTLEIASLSSVQASPSYVIQVSELDDRLNRIDESFLNGGWQLTVFPSVFESERFRDTQALREALLRVRESGLVGDCLANLGDTEFGVCATSFEEAIAVATSGLLMFRKSYRENSYEYTGGSPTPPETVAAGQWLDYEKCLFTLGGCFQFMERWSNVVNEELSYEIVATKLLNRYLATMNQNIGLYRRGARGPTHTERFSSSGTFTPPWKEQCASTVVDLCNKFVHGLGTPETMLKALDARLPD